MENSELIEQLKSRIQQLDTDYKNVLSTISRLDRDRNDLVSQGINIKGASEELQRLLNDLINKQNKNEEELEENKK